MNQRENEFEYTTPEEENWMDTVKDDMRGGELEEADGGRFRIRDTEQASWAFRKIKKANQELADLEAYAKREIEKIQTWLAKVRETHPSRTKRPRKQKTRHFLTAATNSTNA